ncbi:MAG TPA: adenylate/guanylate cyclase domain-containing protein [Candidatus Acidoferrales bacterium]|nr:adenylate/guanylate cyclase domain-containing protein [Candidatus Acidoferrales bacterium]
MPARARALIIALVLALIASAIGAALLLVPLSTLPVANRIADLVAHVSFLDDAPRLGFRLPAYETAPNPDLAIVTIDDVTLKKMNYPLPRNVYGAFLDKLRAAGVKTVVFDIDFIEEHAPAEDGVFAAAMRRIPTVLGFPIDTTSTGRIGEEPPAPLLRAAAAAAGFNTLDTPGGYLIGQPLEIDTSGPGTNSNQRLSSLSAAAVSTYRGRPVDARAVPAFDEGGGPVMLLLPPPLQAHQDIASGTEIDVAGFAGRGTLSFSDVVASRPADLKALAGAIVYVGATAQGLGDYATTAGRGRQPGLFINARLADQLMRRYYLRVAPRWLDLLLVVLLPVLAALTFSLTRTLVAVAVSLAATLAMAYLNLYLFVERLYWLDLVHVGLAMLLGTMFVAVYRVVDESSQRRMVTGLFGMHVSPAIVDDILKHDDPRAALALRGKRVKATIFYSDIRGFTSMSESMTPEEIYGQLNEYFEEMCKIIFEHGGYVDKFIGDCVMAVFSAPYQTPDDARNAVVAAVKQQEKIRELGAAWTAAGKKAFTVGMGINTGEVVMGNLGAKSRMNYTVIGDNVNVAARLYNVAKGGDIIVSESTYAECKAIVDVVELEPVEVKGKSLPIAVYNVKGLKRESPQEPAASADLQPA